MFKRYISNLSVFILLAAALLLASCGAQQSAGAGAETPAETAEPTPAYESGAGKVVITEIMAKNKATIRDADGAFSDWVELYNQSSEPVDLSGWTISDKAGEPGVTLPEYTLQSGEYAVLYAAKVETTANALSAPIGISKDDTITVYDRNGDVVDSVYVTNDASDCSIIPDGSGEWSKTFYSTPGWENTPEAYSELQSSSVAAGPLVIYEICTENFSFNELEGVGYPDWVEIKNISSQAVDLSDYYLSDKFSDPVKYNLPSKTLEPGQTQLVLCVKDSGTHSTTYPEATFSLDGTNEQLYIFNKSGELIDFASAKNIPYGGSCGRMDGENGFFLFSKATPGSANSGGERRLSEMPVSSEPDGVFNSATSATVTLTANGKIYYTTDGTVPTAEDGTEYTGSFTVGETCVVRAISVEDGALPSRTLTLNYILNEGISLPVVCVSCDNPVVFNDMYTNGYKMGETPGHISYYGDDGTFSLGCGIKMQGDTSLVLFKKNLSFRFRGCYGQDELSFDLFGGGVTDFTNLIVRAGQDQNNTIIRSEVVQTLASQFSDNLLTQRSKYVVLYVNGRYRGVHTLIEKANEQFYADAAGVSKDSVSLNELTAYSGQKFYQDVLSYLYNNTPASLADDEVYEQLCSVLDIDALIDWDIIEGWSGNYDLASGNLKFVSSTENGGQWTPILYDLDCAFAHYTYCFENVFNFGNQISTINTALLNNAQFRTKFLQRASEAFSGPLSDENVLAVIDELSAQIDSQVARDESITYMSYDGWQEHLTQLRSWFDGSTVNWNKECVDKLRRQFNMTQEEIELYFPWYYEVSGE